MKKPDGSPSLNYQGNWRDIFQNWEAPGLSFPAFIPGMITRFLNASTADGYNPYRLTRQGFDWEVPEPDNPWAYIGYWGDHQIIYLLRLMELQEKFFPGNLLRYANPNLYVYARVPYRIKKHNEILQNPQDTINFETELNEQLIEKSRTHGNDGKWMHYASGELQRAGFMEKILVSLLAKLSNFVPQAGSEIDLFAGFSAGVFTFSINDYFVLPDSEEYNYFDFRRTHTGHTLEGVIEFAGPESFPVELTWGTFFYGDDFTDEEEPMFSSYFEARYPFVLDDHTLSVFAGFTPWESLYADKAALVNVGLNATKTLQLGQHFSMPLAATLMVNPWEKKTLFVFSFGF